MSDTLLEQAYQQFDAANAEDPNRIEENGSMCPKELVFARRLTEEVLALDPDASECLRLAARCQHIRRWQVPRSTQPMGRAGYLKWRAGLKKFHAAEAAKILKEVGYDSETIESVQALNLKKNLATDPDCQTLEDALCLVFLKYQFDELIENTDPEKMIRIVSKTWAKMSPRGQQAAGRLSYSAQATAVLEQALAND